MDPGSVLHGDKEIEHTAVVLAAANVVTAASLRSPSSVVVGSPVAMGVSATATTDADVGRMIGAMDIEGVDTAGTPVSCRASSLGRGLP